MLTAADVDNLDRWWVEKARVNFLAYRQYMRASDFLSGWFIAVLCLKLQIFYQDLVAGKRPVLFIQSPPQHGKSWTIVDFIAWISGKMPTLKTIYASYSDILGIRANNQLQRFFDNPKHQAVFPDHIIGKSNTVTVNTHPKRNSKLIEFADKVGQVTGGCFRNTTVAGSVTGETLSLGVIDDAVKGREQASSITWSNKIWDWFTDDFSTRFSDDAGLLIIMTRWTTHDIIGRLIERFDDTGKDYQVINFQAIAEQDEEKRSKGEALFPELKSLEFLEDKKRLMTAASWESLYQGNPTVRGGDFFKVENFELVNNIPHERNIIKSVRYWDKAGSKDQGAYTAGVLMCSLRDGKVRICDVKRGQWSAGTREKIIKQTAEIDDKRWPNKRVHQVIEQEPGSGGKESAENTIRNLVGHIVKKDRASVDKVVRSEPYQAAVENELVEVINEKWTQDFIDEHEIAPAGKYKDQWDSASGAYNYLFLKNEKRAGTW